MVAIRNITMQIASLLLMTKFWDLLTCFFLQFFLKKLWWVPHNTEPVKINVDLDVESLLSRITNETVFNVKLIKVVNSCFENCQKQLNSSSDAICTICWHYTILECSKSFCIFIFEETQGIVLFVRKTMVEWQLQNFNNRYYYNNRYSITYRGRTVADSDWHLDPHSLR